SQGTAIRVSMSTVPNMAFGKVANRHAVRLFFPRMYRAGQPPLIPSATLEMIYNKCLHPVIMDIMPNQATHWPVNYAAAMTLYRNNAGHLQLGSLDVPSMLLHDLCNNLLTNLHNTHPTLRDAYFGHELRGWKGATAHDGFNEDDRQEGLEAMTSVLDLNAINPHAWHLDVAIEYGIPSRVVTWRAQGHRALLQYLLPDTDITKLMKSKNFFEDNVMHMNDVAGFHCETKSFGRDAKISYIQAYTTEKSVSYQLHNGIYATRKPQDLLSKAGLQKMIKDLDTISTTIFACAGNRQEPSQEGCARLEVRIPLSEANNILHNLHEDIIRECVIQIPASHWW
ncbi:hypothetical protein HYDPIDRAFT_103939, partial [Hydnomerulius pinastri MD-312]